ncbi:MAG: dolichol kinase [Nitrososphaerota archaeon]
MPTPGEFIYVTALFVWVLFVSHYLCKRIYNALLRRGCEQNVAVYYNRKIIHILAGGLVSILVPFLFKSFTLIAILVTVLAIGNYLPHRSGRIWYWYQVKENMYEVHFIIMWGLIMGLGFLLGNLAIGVLPILFMSVGDGITGLVRNMLYHRRTKSSWGNLAMALFCIPAGLLTLGVSGAVAGFAASLVEKLEFRWIDDNITVPLISFIILLALPMSRVPVFV